MASCYTLIKTKILNTICKALVPYNVTLALPALALAFFLMTLFDSAGFLIYTLQVFWCSKIFMLRYLLNWDILLPTILQNESYSFFSSLFKCHFLRETFPDPSNSNFVCLQRSHCKPFNNRRYCNFKLCIYLCDFCLMFVLHPGFNYFILTFPLINMVLYITGIHRYLLLLREECSE